MTSSFLAHLMLDPQLVRHHGDEFGISRLRLRDADAVAEEQADAVDVAARPGVARVYG